MVFKNRIPSFISRIKWQKRNRLKSCPKHRAKLNVSIERDGNLVVVNCGVHKFSFTFKGSVEPSIREADFAAWLCLPIAMSEGKDLVIYGQGTQWTKENAEKLSDIWASWMPERYSMVNISFDAFRKAKNQSEAQRVLMCFSGGVDSTYSFITHDFGDTQPDLLTIQGMDYAIEDSVHFQEAIIQANILVKNRVKNRLFVKSNAYDVYKTYGIGGQLSHIFLLTAVGFMFSRSYEFMLLAADHSYYQQFEVFPAGSTFASNRYYDSGDFKLITHGEDTTRAEKLASIADNPSALLSLSFCKNRKIRPKNCGVCFKCLRTKYMFLASNGEIPKDIFLDSTIPSCRVIKFSNHESLSNSYIKDTYKVAFRSGNLDKVPMIIKQLEKIKKRLI